MLILTIRTDKPESEIGLFDGNNKLAYEIWQAHRQLAETIHQKIKELMHPKSMAPRKRSNTPLDARSFTLDDIQGIVVYKGPGSFTGLRIGTSVANALAYSLGISVVGTRGEDWVRQGLALLQEHYDEKIIVPEYGGLANITKPRK